MSFSVVFLESQLYWITINFMSIFFLDVQSLVMFTVALNELTSFKKKKLLNRMNVT